MGLFNTPGSSISWEHVCRNRSQVVNCSSKLLLAGLLIASCRLFSATADHVAAALCDLRCCHCRCTPRRCSWVAPA
jgi:hypothetical protein